MTRRVLLFLGLLLAACGRARAQVPPDAAWRTLDTEHFRVTFPARLEILAARAGDRAEAAYDALARAFHEPPEGTIELVLTDHVDLTNGFAELTPWKRITVFARPPADGFALVYFDDWLELVLVHELAHIFHLDMTGPVGSVARTVFGRVPASWPVFPQRSLPTWAVEGLATWYESSLTASGRLKGTFHEMMLRTAVLEGRFEGLDQASGRSPVWPAGDRPYLYGSRFFAHLLDRHGEDRMEAFAEAVSDQWVPYRLDAAGEEAFGVPLSEAWSAWRDTLGLRYRALVDTLAARRALTEPEAVSDRGRLALHPRVSLDGSRVVWSHSDGLSDIQLRVADPDGSDPRKLARINGSTVPSWTRGGGIVFSQLEFRDPYRIRRDLYRLEAGGGLRRITRGARVSQPDVHPREPVVVAVQDGQGTNRLVLVELDGGRVTPLTRFRPGVHWAFPRWSPDGRWVAVGRWQSGARYDVVVLDREGREAVRLTRDRAVDLAPAWSPDGRRVLWSSDRTGIPNLFAAEVDPERGSRGPVRQVTNLTTGGSYPSVDPAGRWIHFSVYHADGWHVARVPYDPGRWFEPFPTDPRFRDPEPRFTAADGPDSGTTGTRSVGVAPGRVRDYSPFPSLYPRYWEPLLEAGRGVAGVEVMDPMVGASTSGSDLVGRHAYSAWLQMEADGDRRVEGSAAYDFAGLGNPILGLSAGQFHDVLGRFVEDRPDESGVRDTLFLTERERQVEASVTFRRPRIRSFLSASLSGAFIREERTLLDDNLRVSERYGLRFPESELVQGALTLSWGNSRSHAFSVSREDGLTAFLRGRIRRDVGLADSLAGREGVDRGFQEATGRIQLFRGVPGPGFANHVLALRLSGGIASGPGADRFHFDVGGTSGRSEALTGLELFGGSGLFFPVRGYPRVFRSGRYAWTGSLEYRVPLALVHRGLGALPLYLDRVSASVFVDGGNAWGPVEEFAGVENPRRRALWSAGAEVLASTLPFWATVLDLRVGVAFPLVGSGDPESYLRLGWSF